MSLRCLALTFWLSVLVGNSAFAELTRQERTELFVQANDAFRRANSQADTAQAERLYEQAILGYERIINAGNVSNPMLYYNLANAYLLKDDIGRAILNYRRAEALDRSSRDIRKNLAFARTRCIDTVQIGTERRVLQTLFFWHYDFSLKGRFTMACIFFAILCLSLTFMVWRGRNAACTTIAVITGLLALCFTVSVITGSITRAHHIEGVITADEVIARQADWPDAAPSFKDLLHAGLEFELIEQRRDHLHIRLPDGSDGWIPTEAAELI